MKKVVIVSIVGIFLNSCGTLKLSVKPGCNFSRNATLTIIQQDDESGTVGELNHLLFEKGFNIVSYSTAKKAIKYKQEIKGDNIVNYELDSELYTIKELNSIYALELNYKHYYDYLYYAYLTFSARLIDLNTNEVVMSANFRGDRSVKSVLRSFTQKLSEQIK